MRLVNLQDRISLNQSFPIFLIFTPLSLLILRLQLLVLDPKNTAAQNQITLIRHKRKETKEREKKLYSSIFSKMAKASEKEADLIQKKQSEAMDPSSVGEWSDEEDAETRNEEMEKIMMLDNPSFTDKL